MNQKIEMLQRQSPLTGFHYFWRGLRWLTHKQLRRYVWIPLCINVILFISLLSLGIHSFKLFISWFEQLLPTWLQWLHWLLWILFSVLALLMMTYTFNWLANLIAAPFNGLLAEKVEQLIKGTSSTESGWHKLPSEVIYALKQQFRLLGYYLPRALIFLLCLFVPFLHAFVPFFWFLFNAWTLAIQYIGYPMENRHLTHRTIRKQVAQYKSLNLGFGCAVALANMIPLINLIVMPAGVIGGTILYIENYSD